MKLTQKEMTYVREFILRAYQEDIGEGDHSTLATIDADKSSSAVLVAKEDGIIAGLFLIPVILELHSPDLRFSSEIADGDSVSSGQKIGMIQGPAQGILSTERLVLNIIQRMSGIATKTHRLVELIRHTSCTLIDTRKTTPLFRLFEKKAVLIGGGANHRMGLYDMVMLKDNHIDFAGGITAAVKKAKQYLQDHHLTLKIEVETRNLEEVKEALAAGADLIMLDNMGIEEMREAVKIIDNRVQTEASGGISENNLVAVAETGVNYISMGALTHSYSSLDISLKAIL